MKNRKIWVGLTCVIAQLVFASAAMAQQLEPLADGQRSTAGAKIEQIYNLTEVAKTVVDFERIVQLCEKTLEKTIFDKDREYLQSMVGWSRNRMAQIHARNSVSMKEIGLDEQAAGELANAKEQFDLVIEHNPKIWRAWMGRAKIHAADGEYEEALAKFVEVTKRKRTQMAAWFNAAELSAQLRQYEQAIEFYTRVIANDASDVQARTGRAHCLLAIEQVQAAIDDYKTVVSLQAKDETALSNLGDALCDAEQWEAALATFELAAKSPKSTLGMERLAHFLHTCPESSLVDTERAVKVANLAIENGQPTVEHLNTLAAAYIANGQSDLADEIRQRAVKIGPAQDRQAKLPGGSAK